MVYNLTTKNIEETKIALVGGLGGFRDHYDANEPNHSQLNWLIIIIIVCVQYRDHRLDWRQATLLS